MRKILIALFSFWGLISCSSNAQMVIAVGEKVPDFSLTDQNGNVFTLSEHIGKRRLVIFFYPKDDTPGCTKEACTFRDNKSIFAEYNADIIGISGQDVKSKKAFAEKYQLNFPVLADVDNKVRKLFGVASDLGVIPGRVTYILNELGEVVYIYKSQTNSESHVTESLNFLKSM